MFARVNEFTGTIDQLNTGMGQAEDVSRRVEGIPGSLGTLFMIDRQSGKALGITLWEDEAAMKASESAADTIRKESSTEAGTQVMGVGRYEVVVNTVHVPSLSG
jgi:hypothetical protein